MHNQPSVLCNKSTDIGSEVNIVRYVDVQIILRSPRGYVSASVSKSDVRMRGILRLNVSERERRGGYPGVKSSSATCLAMHAKNARICWGAVHEEA
jgi:hypothetical protein